MSILISNRGIGRSLLATSPPPLDAPYHEKARLFNAWHNLLLQTLSNIPSTEHIFMRLATVPKEVLQVYTGKNMILM